MEDTLCNNYAIREEELIQAAEDAITLSYDENSDSEISNTSSEPATSSNKASILLAKHTADNKETHLRKTILDHGHFKNNF